MLEFYKFLPVLADRAKTIPGGLCSAVGSSLHRWGQTEDHRLLVHDPGVDMGWIHGTAGIYGTDCQLSCPEAPVEESAEVGKWGTGSEKDSAGYRK